MTGTRPPRPALALLTRGLQGTFDHAERDGAAY